MQFKSHNKFHKILLENLSYSHNEQHYSRAHHNYIPILGSTLQLIYLNNLDKSLFYDLL